MAEKSDAKDPAKTQEERLVVDTCFLLELKDLKKVEELFQDKRVVIPSPVIEEIYKDNYISRNINRIMLNNNVVIETVDRSIILDPTWIKDADYYIVSICVKLKKQGFKVSILSNDIQLCLKARAYGIDIGKSYFEKEEINNVEESEKPKDLPSIITNQIKETQPKKHIKKHSEQKIVTTEFNKPERKNDNDVDFSQYFKIINQNDKVYLEDTSSVDSILRIWKTVINNKGKRKDVIKLDGISSFVIEPCDEIIVFEVIQNNKLYINIGNIISSKFVSQNEHIASSIEEINRYSKKYREIIKEAFLRLLKIAA